MLHHDLLTFYKQRKFKMTVLLLLLFWLIFFPIWSSWLHKYPLEEKINLSSPQTINKTINVRVDEIYSLAFKLNVENLTKERKEKLYYQWIPVTCEIKDKNGNVIFTDTTDIAGANSWNGKYIWRDLGGFRLKKGQYQALIKIDKGVPELADIDTFVEINFGNGKAWSAWLIFAFGNT